MDAAGGGGGGAATASGSNGLLRSVAGYTSSPLFFWLLTVALVAAIHLASGYLPSRSDDREAEEKKRKARRGGFAAAEEREEVAERGDDRILEMMRSFSFVQATEEDFLEGMAAFDRVDVGTPPEPAATPSPPPEPSLSFKFQHQMPEVLEIQPEAAVVSREIPPQDKEEHEEEEEKEPSVPLESGAKQEREDEAEETELVVEEEVEEQRREVVEAAPSTVVATTHSYRFLTERDFRGFVREPEAMTVRVQESFVPPPPPAASQPEERTVVDVAPRRGGFLKERDFRPADEPDACESVASSGKRTPLQKRKPASSPSNASMGGTVAGRTSFASEFSGFGDSDSESSASDGYSVKELAVDSDSDWFLSDKDFPAATRDAGILRSYKTKVLKAIEALDEEATLEQSYQNSATTLSPGSVRQGSPDSIHDGSAKYPEDMWSRSPSLDVEYKEDEKVTSEAEEAEQRSTVEEEVDMSDDERSSSGKKAATAFTPVFDAATVAEDNMEHSDKKIIPENDQPGEAVSDVKRSPEAASERGLAASSIQAAVPDAKRSPESPENSFRKEPLENGLVRTVDHPLEHSSDDKRETASESDQSYEIVFENKRSPEPSETGFVDTNGHSHELISDVWKEIVSKSDQPCAVAYADEGALHPSEEEIAGTNDHSEEPISFEKKVTFSTLNNQSYAVVSDDKSIPETSEQEFSATDHPYGLVHVHDAKNTREMKEEEQATPYDRFDDAVRKGYVSITGKAKVCDDEGEDADAKWKDLTEEEEDELESLWEHQDLIEQLKLELKKVRSIGLPTILEESETPKAPVEDLKPWRIDAKFLREDPMDELNKFYKSYRERMRKFDILCYQKMYAIDFLQLRGPQQPTHSLKSLSPTVASILSHNFRSSRRRSPEDPSERFLKELRYDLETVYVGQMCLSWEFLRWQYEQARDLPESDPYHSHQYNQVAGEFQQFQVVVQRFVEDESFKGPRLPNYINNRCVLRNLLQVPVIKEDSLKDRMEDQRKGNYVITSEELEDIMEEAMHILWEFIKADKVETATTSVLKGLSSSHVELQDPSDQDLMAHIHASLQKKEKRLKDLLRTGNCIVKKFKKPKEDRSNQNLFFSQVDMRLVARVLRMPRITSDQLQWCKAKLDKIILLENRKIHREPSFLLFPC
ncbi:hypothetical protein ACP70R_006414 [Stipagrostis hirtigluma subsp. patula]